jgi:hypothetical protein
MVSETLGCPRSSDHVVAGENRVVRKTDRILEPGPDRL